DNGKNYIEKDQKKLVLKRLQHDTSKYYKDNEDDSRGFLAHNILKSGEKLTLNYIYAGFIGKPVFLNKLNRRKPQKLKFYYTKFFTDIDNVLDFAEQNYDKILNESGFFENLLSSYEAPPEKKFLIAIAFRTFLANTWLLINDEEQPEYYVWEGGYGLNSPIDVAMEVELLAKLFPWTLKLQLMQWKKYITINKTNGLYYLMHDMGENQEVGYSYYDEKILQSKPLAVENNSNFTILLYWFYHITKDKEVLEQLYPTAFKLLIANIKRGFRKRGIANIDTTTTYNASNTLYNAPLNTYLGIKQCISYIMGRELSSILGLKKDSEILQKEAEKILETIEFEEKKCGYIPISLDTNFPSWDKKTIATADPFFYVAMCGLKDQIIDKLIELLAKDFKNIYHANDTGIYGIRLVEDEEITWFSKVAVIDAVSCILFKIKRDSWKYAHKWNENNPLAYCDGAFSEKKEWNGIRFPRGVSLMWEMIYDYKC
ncbi:MAG: hypothetical protein EU532_01730, partial [Promethearchaeota archaeon]